MSTREKESALNRACAEYLRKAKAVRRPRPSNASLGEATGLKADQVRRLLDNQATFTMDTFLSIAEALGINAMDALAGALTEVDG